MAQPANTRVERNAGVLRSGRRFYLTILALLWLCATACGSHPRERSVVLVVVDTLRADHLSLQGYGRGTSPALERRAAQGVVFERALSTSSWTLPSFGSLLTGRLPARHAAGLRVPGPGQIARLGDDVGTLAELLRARGYATAARVTNPYLDDRFGLARGFDSYRNEPVSNRRIRRAPRIFERALEWIREQKGRPFFLLVHVFDPHMDYDPPEEVGVSLWPLLIGRAESLPRRALYAEATLYGPPLAAIVRWPHKLVIGSGSPQLFDLEGDPAERRDLASEQPERVEALKAELRARLERTAHESAPRQGVELDDGLRDQLRALGYLAR